MAAGSGKFGVFGVVSACSRYVLRVLQSRDGYCSSMYRSLLIFIALRSFACFCYAARSLHVPQPLTYLAFESPRSPRCSYSVFGPLDHSRMSGIDAKYCTEQDYKYCTISWF